MRLDARHSISAFITWLSFLFLLMSAVSSQASTPLTITEIMWKSSHPDANAEGDWFELTNLGDEPINLKGYIFDDDDRLRGDDFAILPDFEIQPNETILVVQEDDVDVPRGFRDAWGLPAELRILSQCTSTGGDTFSGISSGGDELNFYAPTAIDDDRAPTGEEPLISLTVPAATAGFTWNWDSIGDEVGLSIEGELGARKALHDGTDNEPPYPSLDIASPGYVEGIGMMLTDLPHLECPVPVACDLDGSGACDIADLNALTYSGVGSVDMSFDLDGSGVVDLGDRDEWLRLSNSLPGDANLDGVTNAMDLNALGSNWLATDVTTWEKGDFNGDGSADVTDLNEVGLYWANTAEQFAASAAAPAAVPEPSSSVLLLLGGMVLVLRRKTAG